VGDDRTTATVPFECGLLAWPILQDALAYLRAHGARVEVHRGGGWITRRGWIQVTGTPAQIQTFLRTLSRLDRESRP
jgi:hypothetical protein